ncbi:Aft1 HRA domain-containing protein [Paraphoma chrysanthemicola]|nr:Aft1 HRA domain-containing protein [Paraphoma chrysanthemicola]
MSSPKDSKTSLPAVTKTEAAPTEADKSATTNAQPLAPPPKPAPSTTGETPDYFNTVHNPFSLEPNVFEQSFVGGNGSAETPGGRPILPPVANITSPSPLPGITPGWQSLRAGPLSPAMLSGPTGQTDYFSESFRGFPTPNESSLRTGLTPGGGGSMFPQPSPNTQAIFNLQSAGVTPGTGDFQAAALRAAAQANHNKATTTGAPTSQPEGVTAGMDRQNNFQQPQQQQRNQNDPYANHDVSSAANDLLSFASQNGGARNSQPQFSMPPQQQSVHAGHMPVQPVSQVNHVRRDTKGSINSMASAETGDFSESGQSEQAKTATRSRAKKGAANGKQAAGNKRNNDDVPKGSRKKSKAQQSMEDEMMGQDSDDDMDIKDEETHKDGRKMTDEEKRKNFLERNRVAALKCRQRKKQWLANLQAKVELFSTENDALSATVTQLREEIVNLKTLLLAHKDCPVSQAQGLHGAAMNNFLGSDLNHQNPYGIAQLHPNGVQMMPMQPGQMMNRFVYPQPPATSEGEQEHARYSQPEY